MAAARSIFSNRTAVVARSNFIEALVNIVPSNHVLAKNTPRNNEETNAGTYDRFASAQEFAVVIRMA
jgi:hypothetical protein